MATLDFTTLFKDRGASRGIADLSKQFTKAAGSADQLEAATKRLDMAERRVADAAGAVRVAESRLQQVRNNAKASAAQRLAAEEKLASAQRRHIAAQKDSTAASHRMVAAQKAAAAAIDRTGDEAEHTASRLRRAMGGVKAFGSAGVNATGKLTGGFKAVGVGVAGVATGILAAVAAPVAFGLKTAAAMENAEIAFTTMLGSARKAGKFLEQLQAFAAKTPFEFPELQTAASSLISVGVNANRVIPIMTTLGNVTSGMGTGSEGVQRATVAIQQMSAAGRITAEDLNQLRDAGIPLNTLFAAMGERLGVSSKKLFEMSRNGELGKKELVALMQVLESGKGFERFNGLMDKQSKSLNGMLSTLKDTFGQGMAEALEGAIPFIKQGIKAITGALGDYFKWVNTHQEDQVAGFVAIGEAVFGIAEAFLRLNASALDSIGNISNATGNWLRLMSKVPGWGGFEDLAEDLMEMGTNAKIASGDINNKLLPEIQDAHNKWTEFGKDQRTAAAMRDGNNRIQRALEDTRKSIKENGRTLDVHTEKGANNRQALRRLAETNLDYIDKLKKNRASTKQVDKATDDARAMFIKTATAMTGSKKKAVELANSFGLLDRRIDTISNKKVSIKFSTNADGTYKKFKGYAVNLTSPSSAGRLATGGPVKGPGTGTSDSIPYMLSNGEYVVNAKQTAKHRPVLEAINSGRGLATGGYVNVNAQKFPSETMNVPKGANMFASAFGKAVGKRLGAGLAKAFKAVSAFGNLPGGGPAIGRGQRALIRYAAMLGMGASSYPGHHPSQARARDFSPVGGGRGNQLAGHAWANRNPYGVWYVIWNRRIASINHGGGWRPYTRYGSSGSPSQMHTNHVHVAWRDKGGHLKSGQTGMNISGQPERVLSPTQTQSFDRMVQVMDRAGGGVVHNYYVNAPNYVGDKKDLVKALTDLDRQGRLAVVRR